jgi:hypothetical protein
MNSRIFAAFNFGRQSPKEQRKIRHYQNLAKQLNPFAEYRIKNVDLYLD